MANYPLTPVTLSNIDETTPTQLEDAAKLGDAMRQTRTIFKGLLGVIMNDDGTLKSTAIVAVGAGSIGTAALADGSVTTAKLATNAVTTVKITDANVTTVKIADANVTTAKIADANITNAKMAANSVDTSQIVNKAVTDTKLANDASVDASRAVGPDHIKSNAVTTAKIADGNVTPAKISSIGSNKVLVGTGSATVAATVGGSLTASYNSGTGTLEFSLAGAGTGITLSTAVVSERASATGVGGSTTGGSFVTRPVADSTGILVEETDPLNIISIVAGKVKFAVAGDYLVTLMAGAYSVGLHVARLVYDSTNVTILENGVAGAPAGVLNYTYGEGIITINADGDSIRIEHWTELTKATNGFGIPHGITGINNRYLYLHITKIEPATTS